MYSLRLWAHTVWAGKFVTFRVKEVFRIVATHVLNDKHQNGLDLKATGMGKWMLLF